MLPCQVARIIPGTDIIMPWQNKKRSGPNASLDILKISSEPKAKSDGIPHRRTRGSPSHKGILQAWGCLASRCFPGMMSLTGFASSSCFLPPFSKNVALSGVGRGMAFTEGCGNMDCWRLLVTQHSVRQGPNSLHTA